MNTIIDLDVFISLFLEKIGEVKFRRGDLEDFARDNGYSRKMVYTTLDKRAKKISHGVYELSKVTAANYETTDNVQPLFREVAQEKPKVTRMKLPEQTDTDCFIPETLSTYVRWGHAKDVMTIIKSGMFYPVYITGPSGNGKTVMVEQACAELKRQYVRVQISPETDEDDLIGGFRLVNGETVFAKGPVIKAMEAGAILLCDELDRGSNKLMALQGVLEGKPIMIKKTGEIVKPAPGFNVIATSNTKGRGSEDGRYIAASIIDEAFLERFTITVEQPYPSEAVERKIIMKHMVMYGHVDQIFAEKLTTWAAAIRKTFYEGGVEEVISTRRLCHIAQTFAIFKDRIKAVELCVARFDADTKIGFMNLYKGIDASANPPVDLPDIPDNPF